MRKVIFKERLVGATTEALAWLLESKISQWVYITATTSQADTVRDLLREKTLMSLQFLQKFVITERQLAGLRGHRLERIVIDEFGYFRKPLQSLKELLSYPKPHPAAGKSDLMIIIGKESCQHMCQVILREILDGNVIFEGI